MPDILDSDQAPTFCGSDLYQNWSHTCTLSADHIKSLASSQVEDF